MKKIIQFFTNISPSYRKVYTTASSGDTIEYLVFTIALCNKDSNWRIFLKNRPTRQASVDSYLITPPLCDVKCHCTGLFLGLI